MAYERGGDFLEDARKILNREVRGPRQSRFSIGSAPLTSITKSDAQISGGETRQGETPGIFIVLSGFATSDLSVDFCDARQGGGAYGKTPATRPFYGSWPFAGLLLTCSFLRYPLILWITVLPPLSELIPLAAAERPSAASQ